MTRLGLALAAGLALAGCNFGVDDVGEPPENPTFAADVQPLLRDHCTLCHGKKATRDAPGSFRLDVYDDVDGKFGAKAMAHSILKTVEDDEMPPAAEWGDGLGPNGKELLRRWVANGAPP